jgi:hypothetical protein
MSNTRCGNCGFLNFASDASCKRCKATFVDITPPQTGPQLTEFQPAFQGGYQIAPGWSQPAYQQPAYQPSFFPTPIAPLPQASKHGATNASLWVLLSLSVALACGIGIIWKFGRSAPTINGWQEYRSPDNSFTVQMPVKPEESVQSESTPAGQIQLHIASGEMGAKGIYLVGYADYPAVTNNAPPGTILDAAANGAVNNSGAILVSKRSITQDGYQGIEAEMTIPESKVPGGGKAVCRIFWNSPRVYILFVGGTESSGIYESREKFLDTFKIRK